jgi:hypothetical protein
VDQIKELHAFDLKNPRTPIPVEKIDLPVDDKEYLDDLLETQKCTKKQYHEQLLAFSRFYETVCIKIRKRFDFGNEILNNLYVLEPFRLINTADTRWLSLQVVATRFVKLWDPIVELFRSEFDLGVRVDKPDKIYCEFSNPFHYAVLLFLKTLHKVYQMNVYFQSEDALRMK